MKRKITFPHAGNYWIAFKYFLESCGYDIVMPPAADRKTLDIGVKNAPSQGCLPFKITLGSVLQGVGMGADTIMMLGARMDVCRVAYFNEMYKKIAADDGKHVELLDLHPKRDLWLTIKKHCPEIQLKDFLKYCYGFWLKMKLIEKIRAEALQKRPYEIERGECSRISVELSNKLSKINTIKGMIRFKKEVTKRFNAIKMDMNRKVIKIGLVGETYLLVDQFATLNIEEYLGELGVALTPTFGFTKFFLASSRHVRMIDNFFPTGRKKVRKYAKPYLNRPIGGRAIQVMGETVALGKRGYDAVIHMYPFSCMPHIIADSMLPKISSSSNLPILGVAFDEHTSEAGLKTRIEAFVDMVRRRKSIAS